MNKSLRYLVACVATIGVVGSPMIAPAYAEPITDPTVTVVPEPLPDTPPEPPVAPPALPDPSVPEVVIPQVPVIPELPVVPPAPPALPDLPQEPVAPAPAPTPPEPPRVEAPAPPPPVQQPQRQLPPVAVPDTDDSSGSGDGTVSSPGGETGTPPPPPAQTGGESATETLNPGVSTPDSEGEASVSDGSDGDSDSSGGNATVTEPEQPSPAISGGTGSTDTDDSSATPAVPGEEEAGAGSGQNTDSTTPNEGTPATDVSDVRVVEAPQPAEALPVPEEVLAMKPEVVAVAVVDDEDDKRSGQRLPKPGRDHVNIPDDDDETPPANPNIVINGDNNTVNFINIVDSKVGDINQDVSDDDRFIVLRNLDRPGHDLRFPVRPNHPIQLPSNWCGGQGGAWAFAGVGFGPNGAYANFGAGVFHSTGNCGYNPRPPRSQHWPTQLVICPPVGYYGHPQRFDHYTFIDNRTIFVNNTFVKGDLVTQVINGAPQQVFVYEGSSPDIVYQAPSQIPPKWMGFQGYDPLGENPDSTEDATVIATDNRLRNAAYTGVGVVAVLIVAAGVYLAARPRREG